MTYSEQIRSIRTVMDVSYSRPVRWPEPRTPSRVPQRRNVMSSQPSDAHVTVDGDMSAKPVRLPLLRSLLRPHSHEPGSWHQRLIPDI